jgi:hypothetical protein
MSQDTCFCIEETWKKRFSRAFKKYTNFAFCFGGTFSFWRKCRVWRNIRELCLARPWPFLGLSLAFPSVALPCHALPCLSLPCLALPNLALALLILALALSCLALYCLALALSRLAWP